MSEQPDPVTGLFPGQVDKGEGNIYDENLNVWVDGPMSGIETAISALNEFREENARIDEVCDLLEWLFDIYDPDSSEEKKNTAYAAFKRDARTIGSGDD